MGKGPCQCNSLFADHNLATCKSPFQHSNPHCSLLLSKDVGSSHHRCACFHQMQMFIAPIHEALDTKLLKLDQSMHSKVNFKRLVGLRGLLFSLNTFVTAMFPFMGDFVNLFGSFSLFPLTFVFPSMIFIKVKIACLILLGR